MSRARRSGRTVADMEHLHTDVCVIGAGFAGLTAARRLTQAGRSTIVLEARDRVGGRAHTTYLADGTPLDKGAAWFGPGQDAAYALAAELGVATYPTHTKGRSIYVKRGKPTRYRGTIPLTAGPLQLAIMGIALKRLDRMARKVPLEAPWDAPKAARWDAISLGVWISRNVPKGSGRELLKLAMTDLYTADPSEVSLLFALHLIHSHGGLERLLAIEGGSQQDRVVGGAGGLAAAVGRELGDALRTGEPVARVTVTDDGVEVQAASVTVHAERVIVAIPPVLHQSIRFEPPLPSDRAHLAQRLPVGAITKIEVIYEDAWWRNDGLNGISLDLDSPVQLTLDGCGPSGTPGILAVVLGANAAREFGRLDAVERRTLLTEALTQRFGRKAADIVDVSECEWHAEQYSRGGSVAHMGPGVMTAFGPALRKPVGPIHWAGTETATVSHGAMDGAIRSGERAVAEVLAALPQRALA